MRHVEIPRLKLFCSLSNYQDVLFTLHLVLFCQQYCITLLKVVLFQKYSFLQPKIRHWICTTFLHFLAALFSPFFFWVFLLFSEKIAIEQIEWFCVALLGLKSLPQLTLAKSSVPSIYIVVLDLAHMLPKLPKGPLLIGLLKTQC